MKPLLLVVENDSGTRRLLDVFLTREAFEVDPVATGGDALLLLERIDYAAVVLDMLIPGRTGRDVLEELAARAPALLERIVVISSATEAHLRDVRGRHPAVAALRKPFDLTELLGVVRERAARHVPAGRIDAAQIFVRRSVTAGAKAGLVARHGDASDVVTSFGGHAVPIEPLHALALDALRHGRAVWVSASQAWREHGSVALAAVPIFSGEQVAGVAGWYFSEPRVFSEDEVARLTAIASEAAGLLGAPSTTASSRRA
jgi:DNA-binding response OmpR family regulator